MSPLFALIAYIFVILPYYVTGSSSSASLEVSPDTSISAGSHVQISCGRVLPPINKFTIFLTFGKKRYWISMNKYCEINCDGCGAAADKVLPEESVVNTSSFNVRCNKNEFPYRLNVSFAALPVHAGPVNCTVETLYDHRWGYADINSTIGYLNVSWPPAVLEVVLTSGRVRVGETVTVTCRYRLGSSSSSPRRPTLEWAGPDRWRPHGVVDEGEDVAGYEVRSEAWGTPARRSDHGRQVVCALGESRRTARVDVAYGPTITHFGPSGVVPVGTAITCAADANPPANVSIEWRRGVSGWRLAGLGSQNVSFTVPLREEAGAMDVRCFAENSVGRSNSRRQLEVQKLPLRMVVEEKWTAGGRELEITCRPAAAAAVVADVRLRVDADDVTVTWRRGAHNVSITRNGTARTAALLASTAAGLRVELPSGRQGIAVRLREAPRYNGTGLSCWGKSAASEGEEDSRRITLNLSSNQNKTKELQENKSHPSNGTLPRSHAVGGNTHFGALISIAVLVVIIIVVVLTVWHQRHRCIRAYRKEGKMTFPISHLYSRLQDNESSGRSSAITYRECCASQNSNERSKDCTETVGARIDSNPFPNKDAWSESCDSPGFALVEKYTFLSTDEKTAKRLPQKDYPNRDPSLSSQTSSDEIHYADLDFSHKHSADFCGCLPRRRDKVVYSEIIGELVQNVPQMMTEENSEYEPIYYNKVG